ncbi:His/Glu/Gln/Arg/opine family amino ABC transporter, permease, 3-TM region [Anopheles sinensis]|uniref:His/Glu/Gln/Arg/opine family amino ABC transporter, permease, 3-TM region n=1 Tax=Anopheles sinensis TaxID=74873 RepID=A0A084W4V9_ANOSI|nr:His/Glu/Gln/Arg/opine family amino ABC transporter, permease, 3-TM region [Anopheles sinensis]
MSELRQIGTVSLPKYDRRRYRSPGWGDGSEMVTHAQPGNGLVDDGPMKGLKSFAVNLAENVKTAHGMLLPTDWRLPSIIIKALAGVGSSVGRSVGPDGKMRNTISCTPVHFRASLIRAKQVRQVEVFDLLPTLFSVRTKFETTEFWHFLPCSEPTRERMKWIIKG